MHAKSTRKSPKSDTVTSGLISKHNYLKTKRNEMLKINLSYEAITAVVMAVLLAALMAPAGSTASDCLCTAIIAYGLVDYKILSRPPLQHEGYVLAVASIALVATLALAPSVFIAVFIAALAAYLIFGHLR